MNKFWCAVGATFLLPVIIGTSVYALYLIGFITNPFIWHESPETFAVLVGYGLATVVCLFIIFLIIIVLVCAWNELYNKCTNYWSKRKELNKSLRSKSDGHNSWHGLNE